MHSSWRCREWTFEILAHNTLFIPIFFPPIFFLITVETTNVYWVISNFEQWEITICYELLLITWSFITSLICCWPKDSSLRVKGKTFKGTKLILCLFLDSGANTRTWQFWWGTASSLLSTNVWYAHLWQEISRDPTNTPTEVSKGLDTFLSYQSCVSALLKKPFSM